MGYRQAQHRPDRDDGTEQVRHQHVGRLESREASRKAHEARQLLQAGEDRRECPGSGEADGYLVYTAETAQLVVYIRTAQQLGFSLADIGDSMPAVWNAPDPDAAVTGLLAEKVTIIDERIAELQRLRDDVATRIRQQCPLSREGGGA